MRHNALMIKTSGGAGWDEYADFYDWENAQTMARRDVAFWRALALAADGPVLELGCGTGRVTLPLARAGVARRRRGSVGADAERARDRVRAHAAADAARDSSAATSARCPFDAAPFALVAAPYGILQSLLQRARSRRDAGCRRTRAAPGGRFVIELVADLPSWQEYRGETRLRGWRPGKGARHARRVGPAGQPHAASRIVRAGIRRAARRARRYAGGSRWRFGRCRCRRCTEVRKGGIARHCRLGSYDGDPWTGAGTWLLCDGAEVVRRRSTGLAVAEREPRPTELALRLYGPRFRVFSGVSCHVRPFQVAHHQAQEGRRSTPSAARCSRASSRS